MTTTEPTPEAVQALARELDDLLDIGKYAMGDAPTSLDYASVFLRAGYVKRDGPYIEVEFNCVCGEPLTATVTILGGQYSDGRAWPSVRGEPVKHRCPPAPTFSRPTPGGGL